MIILYAAYKNPIKYQLRTQTLQALLLHLTLMISRLLRMTDFLEHEARCIGFEHLVQALNNVDL